MDPEHWTQPLIHHMATEKIWTLNPEHSPLIGYNIGSYNSKANPNNVSLSMNVLWVAVLAASENTLQVYHYLHSYSCSTSHFR
ncbi:uncharacterized protein LACBIDRAFT_297850 [Laccaria bicolor S238N-H82]|uniref:Predicted protein n=1 Tax=Laccaria bicolor (strain S238N-H82 / ATCC MYA-4686) TaxID=486041 RepID=B0DB10_LACBS|nr:uncharacterized protein LACBIDRAFT_297845 [Laccaria bicolor S238N-H82]XP_001881373.1 uncharacterized protein LACBIDRAFT_297850 [Laccaria bicolor S238N-H82]EDR08301.1 predicted protein [Laccaria bicolor S238N-H82]EDR08303.1 predicted protein [Laccaria bicolor S238N-H82]|eukprot:XP_001881371.1 predicted protein [Laccaria bicolor S238N-H82]